MIGLIINCMRFPSDINTSDKNKAIFFIGDNNPHFIAANFALSGTKLRSFVNRFDSTHDYFEKRNQLDKQQVISIFLNASKPWEQILETLEQLGADSELKNTPIIFLTHENEPQFTPHLGNLKNNVVGILSGPFNRKKFMEMVYSVCIYWDNLTPSTLHN